MKTNHIMILDSENNIYCRKFDKIIEWNNLHFKRECLMNCIYQYGLYNKVGVVECLFEDGTDNTCVISNVPERYEKDGVYKKELV